MLNSKKGQTAVPAFFTVAVLIIGVFFSWGVISDVFASLSFTDPLIMFMLGGMGIAVLAASVFSFFVFMGVGQGK